VSELEARTRFHDGDLAGAIELARGARLEPWAGALVAVVSGEWRQGLELAEGLLRGDADDALARWCRATARLGCGDRPGALADWSWILERDPTSRTAWKDRAILRALMGDRAGALSDLAQAAARSPDDVVPHLWIAGLGGPREPLRAFARGDGWRAELAGLVLGEKNVDDLQPVIARESEEEQRRRRCQVHGYAGLVAERDGDPGRAFAEYERCVATDVWHFLTHLWSRERLADRGREAASAISLDSSH
jgi:hypothetical protein